MAKPYKGSVKLQRDRALSEITSNADLKATLLTNLGISGSGANLDNTWAVVDQTDGTKKVIFDVGGNTAAKTLTLASAVTLDRTITFPNASVTLASVTGTETLTNKTLTAPAISAPVFSGTATGTYTLAGTPTLTSPTLTAPIIGVATGTSLAVTGALSSSGTAGIGYAAGAGGTVTQITDRTTGVTINKTSGNIVTYTTSLAAETSAQFTVTNSTVAINDVVILSIRSGQNGGMTKVFVNAVAAGSFGIKVANDNAAGGTAETGAIVINFAVIKAVST